MIGVGIMGAGMAQQLLRTGHMVVVCDLDPERVAGLVTLGARAAASPAELAAPVGIILTVLRDDATVRAVIPGSDGALSKATPGTTFINCSTVTPGTVREIGAAIEAKGCSFLDAPMSGSKEAAASGRLGFFVSGRPDVLESQRDLLTTLGQSITFFGPLGHSATFKLANNQLAAVLVRAIGESIALCEAAGLDRETVVESLVATATRVCGLKKNKLLRRDWSTDFALSLMCKDIDLPLQTAAALDVPMPLLSAAREIYRRAEESGVGHLDCSVVVETN